MMHHFFTFCSTLHLHGTASGPPPGSLDVFPHLLHCPPTAFTPPLIPSVTSAPPHLVETPYAPSPLQCPCTALGLCPARSCPSVAPRSLPPLTVLALRPHAASPSTVQPSPVRHSGGWGLGEETACCCRAAVGLQLHSFRGPTPQRPCHPISWALSPASPCSWLPMILSFPSFCPHPSASPTLVTAALPLSLSGGPCRYQLPFCI